MKKPIKPKPPEKPRQETFQQTIYKSVECVSFEKLGDLTSCIPSGIDHNTVNLDFDYNRYHDYYGGYSDPYLSKITLSYLESSLSKEETAEKHKEAKAKYAKDMIKYKKDLLVYQKLYKEFEKENLLYETHRAELKVASLKKKQKEMEK